MDCRLGGTLRRDRRMAGAWGKQRAELKEGCGGVSSPTLETFRTFPRSWDSSLQTIKCLVCQNPSWLHMSRPLCTCVCLRVYTHMLMYVVCGSQKLLVIFLNCSTLFFETKLSLNRELCWPANPRNPPVSVSLGLGIQTLLCHTHLGI